MSMIKVSHLSFGYPGVEVLSDLSFEVKQGSFLAIAGPNGAGKSTLLNLLCGLLKRKTGSVEIDGESIESYSTECLAQKVSVVRQEFVPTFCFSVMEIVLMARTLHYGQMGFESKVDRQIVNEALEATDTIQFASRPIASLSGGERQRVLIARAVAQNAPILLLDEPTSFLDLKHQVGIYDLLKKMQLEKEKTIVSITHDINLAAQYCDEVLLLGGGGYQHGAVRDILSTEQIEKIFGVRVFEGKVGNEKFFIPLGKFAKDSDAMDINFDINK